MMKMFDKFNLQVASSRINEVHCGILKQIKRYRNSLHSCGMIPLVKCVAFTLAETLVVMGIIGVVAALTIPNLNQSTGDREKVAKLKKVYSNLEDAYGRATAVYGPVETWFVNDNINEVSDAYGKRFADRVTEFMKISKKIDDLNYILADGTSIYINGFASKDGSKSYPSLDLFGMIDVDLDGPNKGKNLYGNDQFIFVVTEQGILPDDTAEKTGEDKPATDIRDGNYYATAWVIMNGNMDYLKCFDELSWDGQTTCK